MISSYDSASWVVVHKFTLAHLTSAVHFFYQSTEAMVHAAVICLLVCTLLSQTRETRHLVNYSRITISMGFDYLKCLTCFSPLDMSDVEGLSLPRKPFHLFIYFLSRDNAMSGLPLHPRNVLEVISKQLEMSQLT